MSRTRQARAPNRSSIQVSATSTPVAAVAERFPDIEFVRRSGGSAKSHVRDGLDVWEYVFIARAYDWDVAKTARHLGEPADRVQLALDYYRAHPDETDAHLKQMEEAKQNAQIGIIDLEELAQFAEPGDLEAEGGDGQA